MWPCRSTFAGITVLPVRSTCRAPAGIWIWPRRPTRENRFPSTMNAEFSIGAVPSPVINRAPSNTVTGGVPACPCIWDEQAAKEMYDDTIKHRPTSLGIEIPFWLKVERVRNRVCARMIHQAIGVHEHGCYTPPQFRKKWGSDAFFAT